jgi:hypothetical protein
MTSQGNGSHLFTISGKVFPKEELKHFDTESTNYDAKEFTDVLVSTSEEQKNTSS